MNEIKFGDDELNKIKDLRKKFHDLILEVGKIGLEKIELAESIRLLEERENNVQKTWNDLKSEEKKLIDYFVSKYGEGVLDMDRGIFIPDKK